jgi:carnitine O-palmitoyltransferase 1, liver isoform
MYLYLVGCAVVSFLLLRVFRGKMSFNHWWVRNSRKLSNQWSKQKHVAGKNVMRVVLFTLTAFVGLVALVTSKLNDGVEFLLRRRVFSIRKFFLRILLRQRLWVYDQRHFVSKLYFGLVHSLSVPHPTTYGFQDVLPPLPVPPLSKTVHRYLRSVRPLLTDEEYAHTQRAAQELISGGVGDQLQRVLVERQSTGENWLEEWWEKYAYLINRVPLVINSNWYGLDRFDPPTSWNARRAANLIHASLDFQRRLDNEELPAIRLVGVMPFCMHQYRRMFGTARVPGEHIDEIVSHDGSQHVVIACRGQFFRLDCYHDDAGEEPLSREELEHQITAILTQVRGDAYPTVGVLTAQDRTTWAKQRAQLQEHSERNRASVHCIESAIVCFCLDEESPDALIDQARLAFHSDGRNRWFDKAVQIIITENGRMAVNAEHTWADAPVVAYYLAYLLLAEEKYDPEADAGSRHASLTSALELPQALQWDLPEEATAWVEAAAEGLRKQAEGVDMQILRFKYFGKNFPKSCRMSPDAFIQCALQLTYQELNGGRGALTYESAQTRLFAHGRTDTTRSCSIESKAFCDAMQDANASAGKRVHLLRKAIRRHVRTMQNAMNGRGVDRHLLALRIAAMENGIELPALFKDKGYQFEWELSTSQTPVQRGAGGGFGPVAFGGYGVSYNPTEQELFFHITSFSQCDGTSSKKFAEALEHTLLKMHALLLSVEEDHEVLSSELEKVLANFEDPRAKLIAELFSHKKKKLL